MLTRTKESGQGQQGRLWASQARADVVLGGSCPAPVVLQLGGGKPEGWQGMGVTGSSGSSGEEDTA